MVLVGMGQDEEVDPPVPRREPRVERDEQAVRVRAAVDQETTAATALDQDRVTLADVEDGHPDPPIRPIRRRDEDHDDAEGQRGGDEAGGPRSVGSPPGRRPRRSGRRRHPPVRGRRTARRASVVDARSGPRTRRLGAPHVADRACHRTETQAAARRTEDESGRHHARDRAPRLGQGDAGEGQRRRGANDPHEDRQDEPARQSEDDRDDARRSGLPEPPADEGDGAGGHRRRHQRDDDEIDRRREEREPAEAGQDDRERRRLRGERDSEALGQPAGQPSASPRPESSGDRRRPGDQPAGRQHRQLEPRVGAPSSAPRRGAGRRPSRVRWRPPRPVPTPGRG